MLVASGFGNGLGYDVQFHKFWTTLTPVESGIAALSPPFSKHLLSPVLRWMDVQWPGAGIVLVLHPSGRCKPRCCTSWRSLSAYLFEIIT